MIAMLRDKFLSRLGEGYFHAALAAAGFSLKAVFVKLAYAAGPVDALTLLALRMGFAFPLFLWLLYLSRAELTSPLKPSDIGQVCLLACLGYYLSSLFDFKGLATISAGLERLILYLYPTLVLLMQAWMTRCRPHAHTWRSMAICYAGLVIAFIHDLEQVGEGMAVATGSAWIFACAMTYALYYLGTGALVTKIGSMRLTGLSGAASCIMVMVHFLIAGDSQLVTSLPIKVWLYAALMAVISTVLPIWWLAVAIQRLGATRAATFGTLGPVLTVFAAWALLGESISLVQLAGLALVIYGVTRLKS